jgi:hypothetical protein
LEKYSESSSEVAERDALRQMVLLRRSVGAVGTGNRKCRWYAREYPEQENEVILPLLIHEPWAPCKARWVWAGAVIFASATCSLQFAKASAAKLLQQEKNNSADVQRGRLNIASLGRRAKHAGCGRLRLYVLGVGGGGCGNICVFV